MLLRMVNSVATRTAREGGCVCLQTATPIAAGGRIAVPPLSYVRGKVAPVRRSGRVSGRVQLGIRLDTVTLPRGTRV
jgi:hypothetical protein